MRVTTVTATLRYSAEAQGAWRSIEVGAEATLTNSDEDWRAAQANLYQQLGQQLRALWNGKGQEGQQNGHQSNVQASTSQGDANNDGTKPREHWCEEHQTAYKKRTGQYGEFWSHQIKGTRQWCNEARTGAR
jgi:hypothetical protein